MLDWDAQDRVLFLGKQHRVDWVSAVEEEKAGEWILYGQTRPIADPSCGEGTYCTWSNILETGWLDKSKELRSQCDWGLVVGAEGWPPGEQEGGWWNAEVWRRWRGLHWLPVSAPVMEDFMHLHYTGHSAWIGERETETEEGWIKSGVPKLFSNTDQICRMNRLRNEGSESSDARQLLW